MLFIITPDLPAHLVRWASGAINISSLCDSLNRRICNYETLLNDMQMGKNKALKTANILRNIARYSLLVIGIMVFIFALLSGAEDYGGGLMGIIKNSLNALPWLLLLILIYVAWKWELIGGIIITILGFIMLYFFNFRGPNFFLITFILCLLIIALGACFIVSWYLRKDETN